MILDGRIVAKRTLQNLKQQIAGFPRPPGLVVIRVGDDPASQIYVRRKTQRAERLGLHHRAIILPEDTTQQQLNETIKQMNEDDLIDGILVQLPLPKHLNETEVLQLIDPQKDVDGFHAINSGLLSQGRPHLVPCTPKGVMRLINESNIELSGKEAVVVGRSNIVGRPIAQLLEQANCTVTVCHSRTWSLLEHVSRADIVVAAVGRPNLLKGSWFKRGCVIIDVGINRLEDGSICGDVEYEYAKLVAKAITPVPGGVGPMTIAMLMENTVMAYRQRVLHT